MTSVGLDIFPVRVINDSGRIGRTFGHFHDQLDHLGIKPAPIRVVYLPGDALDISRRPRRHLQELLHVAIAFGGRFLRRAGYNGDIEETVRFGVELVFVFRDEMHDRFGICPVKNRSADDD